MFAKGAYKVEKKIIAQAITIAVWMTANAVGLGRASWTYYSTEKGNIPQPNAGSQQTASLVLDIDKDRTDDFIIILRNERKLPLWSGTNTRATVIGPGL